MDYSEAIKYLKEHDIKKEDGSYYEFGEDIPEAPERVMTDQINEVCNVFLPLVVLIGCETVYMHVYHCPLSTLAHTHTQPIFLCRFPVEIKSFYMQRCPENPRLTESVGSKVVSSQPSCVCVCVCRWTC